MPSLSCIRDPIRLSVIGAFLLGIAAVLLLFLAYPYGLVAPDTQEYLNMGQTFFHPFEQIADTARGPALPAVLVLALQTAYPGALILWMNGIFFSLSIATVAWTGCILSGKARYGFLLAAIVVLLEIVLNQPYFYMAFALTDAPAAFLLFAGILLIYGGCVRKAHWPLLCGFACLGLSEAFRPMMLIPFFGTAACLWISVVRKKIQVSRLWIAICLAVLLLPIGLWNVRNVVVYGKIERNPYISAHLLTQAVTLWAVDEPVFGDPTIDAALHEALKKHELVPPYRGPDLYGKQPEPWQTVFSFVSSQIPLFQEKGWQPDTIPRELYLRQFFPIVERISINTLKRHPLQYLEHVKEKYLTNYHHFIRNYIQDFMRADSKDTYEFLRQQSPISSTLKDHFLKNQSSGHMALSSTVSGVLFFMTPAIRYRDFFLALAGIFIVSVHVCGLLGCLLFFSEKAGNFLLLKQSQRRTIGSLMILLFMVASLYYLAIAFLTQLQDTRYSAPGMMPLHLLLLVSSALIVRAIFLYGCKAWKRIRSSFCASSTHNPQTHLQP